jgi:hypothetical protein
MYILNSLLQDLHSPSDDVYIRLIHIVSRSHVLSQPRPPTCDDDDLSISLTLCLDLIIACLTCPLTENRSCERSE